MSVDQQFMQTAIDLARKGMESGEGGPFGAIVVKDGIIIGKGNNKVTSSNDPTAHAEVVAIRDACKNLNSFQLHDCIIYTSCEPCPMCLSAIYWARPKAVYYCSTKEDAANIGFDDDYIYHQISTFRDARDMKMIRVENQDGQRVFEAWRNKPDKIEY